MNIIGKDPSGNQVNYIISNVTMKQVSSKILHSTIDSSVVSQSNNTILCNTNEIINGLPVQEQLVVTTNITLTSYNSSSSSFYLFFDTILLQSINQNSVIKVIITDPVFNVSTTFFLVYILQDSGIIQPAVSLSSNSSFIDETTRLNVTINASLPTIMAFASETIIEVKDLTSNISMGYFKIKSNGTSLLKSIIFIPVISSTTGFDIITIIMYGNGVFKTTSKGMNFQIYSQHPGNPELLNQQVSLVQTSTILTMSTNEPVSVALQYGITKGSFTTYTYPIRYVTESVVNLSSIMVLNSNNYYSITITDSLGSSIVYDNNSNYFQLFIQKLDIIPPYNTTSLTITADYHLQFSVSEPVTVTVTCEDYLNTVSTCYSSTVPQADIYGLLTLSLPGMYYTITKVVLTDEAQNTFVLNPNIHFYYS